MAKKKCPNGLTKIEQDVFCFMCRLDCPFEKDEIERVKFT